MNGTLVPGMCKRNGIDDYPADATLESAFVRGLVRAHTAFAVLLLLAVAVAGCRRLARSGCGSSRWRLSWRGAIRERYASSLEGPKVRELANRKHVEFWQLCFKVGVYVIPFLVGYTLLTWASIGALPPLLGADDADLDTETVVQVLGHTAFGPLVYVLASSMLFTAFPSLLSVRVLYCWISVSFVRMYLPLSLPMPLPQFTGYMQVLVPIRLLWLSSCPSSTFVVTSNVVAGLANLYLTQKKYIENDISCDRGAAIQEFINFVVVTTLFFIHRHLLRWQIRATLEAKSSRNVEASIEVILRGVCDAVVQLDEDLKLMQPSRQLDAMLLRSSFMGESRSFLELLHEESDRERFWDFTRPKARDSELPGSLHLAMRDACQAVVPVEVFHAPCLNAMDELFHIVGVREFGDGAVHSGRQVQPPGAAPPDHCQVAVEVPQCLSQEGISELSSVRSEVDELVQVEEQEANEIAVWIDSAQRGFPMVKCTPGFFTNFGGPSLKARCKLLSWIKSRQRQTFMMEAQGALQASVLEEAPREPKRVCLTPTHLSDREITADVHFSVCQEPVDADDGGGLPLIKMTVAGIRYKRRSSVEPSAKLKPRVQSRGSEEGRASDGSVRL